MAEHGFSVNTAVLSKDRMSLDETTIQAYDLSRKPFDCMVDLLYAVPVTQSMISAVSHAHSKYLSYLENEKQKTALEAARKKKAAQPNIKIARKKAEDLTSQLREVGQQERVQSQEEVLPSAL